jgi:hypothetical protein
MTKVVSSKVRRFIGNTLRQVRVSVSSPIYNDVIRKTALVEAIDEFLTQIEQEMASPQR